MFSSLAMKPSLMCEISFRCHPFFFWIENKPQIQTSLYSRLLFLSIVFVEQHLASHSCMFYFVLKTPWFPRPFPSSLFFFIFLKPHGVPFKIGDIHHFPLDYFLFLKILVPSFFLKFVPETECPIFHLCSLPPFYTHSRPLSCDFTPPCFAVGMVAEFPPLLP